MRKLATFARLPRAERAVLTQAVFLAAVVRLALAWFPYRLVARWFAPRPRPSDAASERDLMMLQRRIVWAVSLAANRLLGDRPCLTQAIVARRLLARHGILADLKIGVAKDDEAGLMAHAWLERDGRVLIGGAASPVRYTVLRPIETAP